METKISPLHVPVSLTEPITHPHSSFKVTKLSQDSIDDLADMLHSAIEPYREAGSVVSSILRRTRRLEQEYLRESADYFIVFNENDEVIGGAGIAPMAELPASEGYCELRDLFVSSSERGKGIARHLIYECLKSAGNIGYRRVYLETTPDMKDAQKLFRRFGFRPLEHKGETKSEKESDALACYFILDELDVSRIDPVHGLKRRNAPTS